MSDLTTALSTALLHSLWQFAIVAVILRIALALLRDRAAHTRYVVACAGFAAMAALPIITTAIVSRESEPPQASSAAVAAVLSEVTGPSSRIADRVATGPRPRRIPRIEWVQPWVLPVWIAGVLVFSLRLTGASLHLRAVHRRSMAAASETQAVARGLARRLGISRPVSLAVGNASDGFLTYGWLRPVIMVPAATALGLSPQQFEALIAHELAHVRRHDYLVNVAQMTIETLLFYHPAIWWASSRIRVERELCCDDMVLAAGGDAAGYARALAVLAQVQVSPVGLAAARGPLVQRIHRILAGPQSRQGASWVVPGIVLGLVAMTIGLVQAQERLAAPTIIRGRVTEVGTGQPLAGVTVRAFHVTGIPVPNRPTSRIEDGDQIGPKACIPCISP